MAATVRTRFCGNCVFFDSRLHQCGSVQVGRPVVTYDSTRATSCVQYVAIEPLPPMCRGCPRDKPGCWLECTDDEAKAEDSEGTEGVQEEGGRDCQQ
jgi:hypothetical protein